VGAAVGRTAAIEGLVGDVVLGLLGPGGAVLQRITVWPIIVIAIIVIAIAIIVIIIVIAIIVIVIAIIAIIVIIVIIIAIIVIVIVIVIVIAILIILVVRAFPFRRVQEEVPTRHRRDDWGVAVHERFIAGLVVVTARVGRSGAQVALQEEEADECCVQLHRVGQGHRNRIILN
jgi:hypothetical protein